MGTVKQPVLERIASKCELKPGSGKVVVIEDRPIALFNIGGEYVALDNTCPHRGGSLGDGEVDGETVSCPWHGWEFNCRTGDAVENPTITVECLKVEKRKDGLYVELKD